MGGFSRLIKQNSNTLGRIFFLIILIFIMTSVAGCALDSQKFVILSGSENLTLEPIIQDFARQNDVNIEMKYKGSLDIMAELEKDNPVCDAVWPANSLWITLGDKQHRVKFTKSIMTSPVVFGIRKSLAQNLGFVGKPVSVKDILKAIETKKLSFMMTSASQSNSGASAYIGFLYALLDNPPAITMDDLKKPALKQEIKTLLSGVNRSSGSSDWLKDLFLSGNYNAMVNYESLIIETNQELIKRHQEPLYVVYPYDGLVIADSPLGYLNKGNSGNEEVFKKLQNYLLTDSIQHRILGLGRRTGYGGILTGTDKSVFNPDWGVDTSKILVPIKMPAGEVIREALNLYQTEFKKPALTVFCLDFSGSMDGEGEKGLKSAMQLLLKQNLAQQYLLQSTSNDIITVIPFNGEVVQVWQVRGNNSADLERLNANIQQLSPDDGTDIYSPLIAAIDSLKKEKLDDYIPAVVLMTDGLSNSGRNFDDFKRAWQIFHRDLPVFAIMFGDASESQLKPIAELTRGRLFDGKKDLVDAFKKAKGYN